MMEARVELLNTVGESPASLQLLIRSLSDWEVLLVAASTSNASSASSLGSRHVDNIIRL